MRTYKLYLKDILEAMDSIESFYELVWQTIKERLPVVKPLIQGAIGKIEEEDRTEGG